MTSTHTGPVGQFFLQDGVGTFPVPCTHSCPERQADPSSSNQSSCSMASHSKRSLKSIGIFAFVLATSEPTSLSSIADPSTSFRSLYPFGSSLVGVKTVCKPPYRCSFVVEAHESYVCAAVLRNRRCRVETDIFVRPHLADHSESIAPKHVVFVSYQQHSQTVCGHLPNW